MSHFGGLALTKFRNPSYQRPACNILLASAQGFSLTHTHSSLIQGITKEGFHIDLTKRLIESYLDTKSIPHANRGYTWLRECIWLIVSGELPRNCKIYEAYEMIAEKYGTTWENVERGIRIAIRRGAIRSTGKPAHTTNKEFVMTAVDALADALAE